MSRLTTTIRFSILAVLLSFVTISRSAAQDYYYGNSSSYQQFYDELSPYGEWINDPQYGYVWVPDAGNDFRPYYSNGYWANSEYGNTWVSDYSWGWAPFHYGRWTYSNYYGWLWIPGNEWGPAWVSWRSGGGCYGWAPLGPGISINFSFGNNYYVPDYWWIFTPQQYILDHGFYSHCYGGSYNNGFVRQTRILNNTYRHDNHTYVYGPKRRDLERSIGRPITQYSINNHQRPEKSMVRDNQISMYRPEIREARANQTERPRTFRAAEQPISNSDKNMGGTRNSNYVPQVGGNNNNRPDRGQNQQQMDRPVPTQQGVPVQQFPTPTDRRDQIKPFRNNQTNQPINQGKQQSDLRKMEQEIRQQRSQELQQQQVQQQQHEAQMQQQRAQQQQRDLQQQQQRNQQMQQQRAPQQYQQRTQPQPRQEVTRPAPPATPAPNTERRMDAPGEGRRGR